MSNSASTKTIKGPAGATGATGTVNWSGSTSQLIAGNGSLVGVSPSSALDGGTLVLGANRPTIDANHVGVWYLTEAPTGPFLNQVSGGTSLVYGSITTTGASYIGPVMRQYKCLGPGPLTAGSGSGQVALESQSNITLSTPMTVEVLVRIHEFAPTNTHYWYPFLFVDGYNGLYIWPDPYTNQFKMTVRQNKVDNNMVFSYGSSTNQFERGRPHHIMMTWSGSNVIAYVDGEVVGTLTPGAITQPVNSKIQTQAQLGVYLADLRLSNIARDITYARNAFAAMCAA